MCKEFGLTLHRSYFCTSATISSCFKFTPWHSGKQSSLLPSVESGTWPDCLSVVNEACLKNKPRGASIPRTSPAHHKKRSQGTSSSLVSYFSPYCSLMWDIRALQRRPGEPIPTLAENALLLCCRLARITHAYRRLTGRGARWKRWANQSEKPAIAHRHAEIAQPCAVCKTVYSPPWMLSKPEGCRFDSHLGPYWENLACWHSKRETLVCFPFTQRGHCIPRSAGSTWLFPIAFLRVCKSTGQTIFHRMLKTWFTWSCI